MHAFACATVFVVTLLATLPPALRAGRLKPAEALRHV
jgi:ABC-type lipoprotein release transport system permease subunit